MTEKIKRMIDEMSRQPGYKAINLVCAVMGYFQAKGYDSVPIEVLDYITDIAKE